jgi:hypothetical protein
VLPVETPTVAYTLYAGQAMMRDALGNAIQCDDTAQGEFLGILYEITRPLIDTTVAVQSNGIFGDSMATLEQPSKIECYIANANPGDEGRKVWWLYNNQVQYTPGVNGNYAGTIWRVVGPSNTSGLATVVIQTPWFARSIGEGPYRSVMSPTPAATITLQKWAAGRVFRITGTIPQTVVLPPLASMSSGDVVKVIYDSASGQVVTLAGSGADTINGVATYPMATARYTATLVQADTATPQWLVG